jgi:hypothetical protein
MSCEPTITICGKELTISQSLTVRVAIESFATDLIERGLGNDKHGKIMVKEYLDRIEEIRSFILG